MPGRAAKRWMIGLGVTAMAVLGLRLALPSIVLRYVNRVLADLPGYTGHVEDIDIALLRGAYVIERLDIKKTGGAAPIPFVSVDVIDISVEWKALFNGAIVAEIEFQHPELNFVNGRSEADKQAGAGVDWRDQVKALVPIDINRLAVTEGVVRFADFSASPPVDIYVNRLEVEAKNLTNSEDLAGSLVATVDATGRPMDLGEFVLHATLDPYQALPTFDLDAQVRQVPLVRLNTFLSAYGEFDAEAGTMEVYTELAATGGRFTGYVKPLLTGVKVVSLKKEIKEDKDGPIRLAWEVLMGAGKGRLQNDKTERVAAKVPIEGSFDDPKIGAWQAVGSTLKNAFVEAIFRGLDREIDAGDVGTASAAGPRAGKRR